MAPYTKRSFLSIARKLKIVIFFLRLPTCIGNNIAAFMASPLSIQLSQPDETKQLYNRTGQTQNFPLPGQGRRTKRFIGKEKGRKEETKGNVRGKLPKYMREVALICRGWRDIEKMGRWEEQLQGGRRNFLCRVWLKKKKRV